MPPRAGREVGLDKERSFQSSCDRLSCTGAGSQKRVTGTRGRIPLAGLVLAALPHGVSRSSDRSIAILWLLSLPTSSQRNTFWTGGLETARPRYYDAVAIALGRRLSECWLGGASVMRRLSLNR